LVAKAGVAWILDMTDADTHENQICYLGDGAYVAFNGYAFVLTTSNGVEVTNTIVLEPGHLQTLITFAERLLGRTFD
jgi:hypothetical protein